MDDNTLQTMKLELDNLRTSLERTKQEAIDYRRVLLEIQTLGGTHNVLDKIDSVVSRYGDSGLSMDEEY